MLPDDAVKVCDLINLVFNKYEAPDYTSEGIAEFSKYNLPSKMVERIQNDHFALLALYDGEIVGVIEIRKNKHVSLFFVSPHFQGQGIGKQLWLKAMQRCMEIEKNLEEVTVNSSPYAEKIYEKLGFNKSGPEQTVCGLRFIPMKRAIV